MLIELNINSKKSKSTYCTYTIQAVPNYIWAGNCFPSHGYGLETRPGPGHVFKNIEKPKT